MTECYAFDAEGWMYAATSTPDGYQVNGDGAWTENGIVQTRNVSGAASQGTSGENDVLIAYFSRTNTTKRAAELIQQQTLIPKATLPQLSGHSGRSALVLFRPC